MGLFGFGKNKSADKDKNEETENVSADMKNDTAGEAEAGHEPEDNSGDKTGSTEAETEASHEDAEIKDVSENAADVQGIAAEKGAEAAGEDISDEQGDDEGISAGSDGEAGELTEAQSYYFLGIEAQDDGDDAAAQQYYTQAAELGYAPAQFQLGLIYENGTQVQPADHSEAAKWYEKAAQQDDAAAQFNLGYLYYNELNRKKEGMDWIRKASDNGDEAAQEFLEAAKAVVEKRAQEAEKASERKVLLRKLLGRDELFVTHSTLTRHPRVENDSDGTSRVYIFSSETSAHAKAKELTEQSQPSTTFRYYKKDFLALFAELYTMGINTLCIDDGGRRYNAYLYEVAKRRDNSNLPEDKRPVENPKLQNSMLSYMQEFRRKTDSPDKAYRAQLDRNMVTNMVAGRYLIAFRKGDGEDEGKAQFIVMNNNNTGKSYIPVFTDNIELGRFRNRLKGDNELLLRAADFSGLAQMNIPDETDGFIINPMTVAVPLPREYVKRVNGQRRV